MERTSFNRAGHLAQAASSGYLAVSVFFIAAHFHVAAADELAFGDVGADGVSSIRFLDDPLPGLDGGPTEFLGEYAMWVHDWAHVRVVNRSFGAVSRLTNKSRIAELEAALGSLVAALPQEKGFLSNATVRYAAHRHFAGAKGWTVKGLQPAGAAWVANMAVTPEVKDVSKYIVPSYIQELLARHHPGRGTDLRGLAIFVATLEHLVRAEMLETLYHIFRALQLDSKTQRNEQDVADVLDTFMLVFAFGGVLDHATRAEILRTRDLVATGQYRARWQEATALSHSLLQRFADNHGGGAPRDFSELLDLIGGANAAYSQWHSRTCAAAKEHLVASDTDATGRVPLDAFRALSKRSSFSPRQLFNETAEELRGFGVLVDDSGHQPQVLVANYMSSPAMCLSTASFYQVCCPNACESLLLELEQAAMAPEVHAEMVVHAVEKRRGRPLATKLLQQLEDIAVQRDQGVALHGRALAEWLHKALPHECPAPHAAWSTSPMTPDAWLAAPPQDMRSMQQLIKEADTTTRRHTRLHNGDDIAPAPLKDLAPQGQEPLVKWYANERRLVASISEVDGYRIRVFWGYLIIFLSCVAAAAAAAAARAAPCRPSWGGTKFNEAAMDAV